MIYTYNVETGEYSMTMPFENEIFEGRTDKKPPKTKINEVAVFDAEKQAWQVFKDYRFTHKMIKDNKIFEIENFGDIPSGYDLITNDEAEEIEEKIRIDKLKMTALDFIGVLVSFGLTLEEIDEYLKENIEIKMQLQYCQNVYCGVVKSLMPIKLKNITITAEMVEEAFKAKCVEAQTETQEAEEIEQKQ